MYAKNQQQNHITNYYLRAVAFNAYPERLGNCKTRVF